MQSDQLAGGSGSSLPSTSERSRTKSRRPRSTKGFNRFLATAAGKTLPEPRTARPGGASRKTFNRHERAKRLKAEAKEKKVTEEMSINAPNLSNYTIHPVTNTFGILKEIQALEKKGAVSKDDLMGIDLRPYHDPQQKGNQRERFQFFSSGTHVLEHTSENTVAAVINFRNLNDLPEEERRAALQCMSDLDEITSLTTPIPNNGALLAGRMSGWGLHRAYESNKALCVYVPKQGQDERWENFEERGRPQALASYLEARFKHVHTVGLERLHTQAELSAVGRFDQTHTPIDCWQFGGNSLTVTDRGFCNIQHTDNDESDWVFGIFFTSPADRGRFKGEVKPVDTVNGGEFYFGPWSTGVAVPMEEGAYVEIAWRGKQDYHGTALCTSSDGWQAGNRWACSMQLTKSAVNKVGKYRMDNGGDLPEEAVKRRSERKPRPRNNHYPKSS